MAKSKKTKKPNAPAVVPQVDMVSDFVCPWCWLGYKQFRLAANAAHPKPDMTLRPYMLDPNVPDDGADYKNYKDYMRAKFGDGSSDRFKQSRSHLETAGAEIGINFDFGAITRRPNSLNAHRLLKWAQNQDLGPACAEAIFRAFHEQGQDIGDTDTLVTIAEAVGLEGDIVRSLLASDEDKLEIKQEAMFFKGLGVSGVPTFIYNGQFAIQGAQPPDKHARALKDAINHPPASGD